jgi:hypothetical protein
MVLDYDLSNLPTDQAELWICLQADSIRGQIVAAQAERLGFPLALGPWMVPGITGTHPSFRAVQDQQVKRRIR